MNTNASIALSTTNFESKKFLLNCNPNDMDNLFRDGIYDNAHLRSFGKEIDYLRRMGYTLTDTPDLNGFYHAKNKAEFCF